MTALNTQIILTCKLPIEILLEEEETRKNTGSGTVIVTIHSFLSIFHDGPIFCIFLSKNALLFCTR